MEELKSFYRENTLIVYAGIIALILLALAFSTMMSGKADIPNVSGTAKVDASRNVVTSKDVVSGTKLGNIGSMRDLDLSQKTDSSVKSTATKSASSHSENVEESYTEGND